MELVWFKRDLRVKDHSPLVAAARQGPVVCLFVYEPELIAAADFSCRHLLFINDSLRDLDASLGKLGCRLLMQCGDAAEVIADLHEQLHFTRIRAHQETTNGISFKRDRKVLKWAQTNNVDVVEYRQQGVVRRLVQRDGWAKQWQSFIASPLVPAPRRLEDGAGEIASTGILEPDYFNLPKDGLESRQPGGEREGQRILAGFLGHRSKGYMHGLSSPVTAWDSCSRVSPYLAYGNLSMRTVYQHTAKRQRELQLRGGQRDPWASALSNYIERLAWHCHFIQKLEDEPRIEFENMNRSFDGLREEEFSENYFQAWAEGRTGYPLVDACMRALIATGWINFRMRAMLMSFAAYQLWLHWRKPALHLARCFVDYEPGIHYSQIQMQSGTTGIAALRIYSPIKQVQDQDPDGSFIKSWVPELAEVPQDFLAQPHLMPRTLQQASRCLIGKDYPAPIVEHAMAYASARKRMNLATTKARVSGESERVFQRHGSRRNQLAKAKPQRRSF